MRCKKILFILLIAFAFPVFAQAKACVAVSGTGTEIGDEVACGTEHFYIIDKTEDGVKMLAKYNLYVGDKIDKDDEIFDVETYGTPNDASYAAYEHCETLKETYGEDNVETTGKYINKEFEATEYFCRIYTPLEYEKVQQNSLAIGLYPNGNQEIVYPIYGSVYLDEEVGEKEYDENLDMVPETSQFYEYLEGYKNTLAELGVDILNIGFIKRSGIENLINSVSDKKLTIPTYSPADMVEDSMWEDAPYMDYELFIYKFNIKDYVPEKYKWLYGTSYWVGSATLYKEDEMAFYFDEFLSTVGDYCSYSRGCRISKMGLGLRPVITVNSSDIEVQEINPQTADLFGLYVGVGLASILGIATCLYLIKKKEFN